MAGGDPVCMGSACEQRTSHDRHRHRIARTGLDLALADERDWWRVQAPAAAGVGAEPLPVVADEYREEL